jgi:ATP-dependent helicase/nuclease subunit A
VLARRVEFELADAAGRLEESVVAAAELWPALRGLDHPARPLLGVDERARWRRLAEDLAAGGKLARDAGEGVAAALAAGDAPGRFFDLAWEALYTQGDTPKAKLGRVPGLEEAQQRLFELAPQVHQHEAHLEHRRIVRLGRALLAEYAAYKRQRGLADMADLERCALALLRDGVLAGWVQQRLDARVRHLLIDEFQDTSPLQWHALHAWLSAYAGAGGGAGAPSVFIVGDPKQSIYRFRGAEPRVFAAARSFVAEGLEGHVLECDHTRRNAPEVLDVLNRVFSAAQQSGDYAGFRAHTTEAAASGEPGVSALERIARPPQPARRGGVTVAPVWRDSLTTPRHLPEEVLREREAEAVAAAILALLDAGTCAPSDVMVLCRKRESLRLLATALQARHIPHVAADDLALNEAPEALDLVAVLDAIVSPAHRLSLARALRCPLFGASDADLVAIALQAGRWGDWRTAMAALGPAHPALARADALLARWQEASRHLPPHDLLERIVAEGELRARLVAAVPPERCAQALDVVDAVLAQALVLDAGRYATPYGYVRALKRRAVKVAAPAHPDAVQLLTVHGAKGLEAEVVFVMDADPEPRQVETATVLIDWPVEQAWPRRCAFVYSEAACPPSLQSLQADEEQARRREELNGLYVAMTRARRRLVVSATQPFRPVPGGAPSWWEQVEPQAQAWVAPTAGPQRTIGRVRPAVLALPGPLPPVPPAMSPPASADTPATRLGQAVHRVLEWATATATAAPLAELADAAAAEFAAPAGDVARIAGRILAHPDSARFFAGPALRWAGNEVPFAADDELLRIDRLVRLDEGDGPVWWVLDYKLQHRPQELPAYHEQLRRYRTVVQRARPGEPVRCALVTGEGAVVEVS